jgi:hypothetical protein
MTIATSGPHASVKSVSGVGIPDTKLAREITEFIQDTETELLFNHSSRVYYFGALAGKQRELKFDAELLYAGAMFWQQLMPLLTRHPKSRASHLLRPLRFASGSH